MQMPTEYNDDFLGYESGFGAVLSDGMPMTAPRTSVYSLVFPPVGFFPFYGIGNGDYHGFYWPLGSEKGPPLVAFSSHDVWSLIPEQSNIEALFHCRLAESSDEGDSPDHYRQLATQANGKPPKEHNIRGVKYDDFDRFLSLDPESPFYLCAVADVSVARGDLAVAEQRYRQAIELLPEYVAAQFGLAYVLRRQRRDEDATIHLRQTLTGPFAFHGGSFWSDTCLPGTFRNDWHRKALLWLQKSKKIHQSIVDDPFIRSVSELRFETGLAVNPDMEVLRELVDDYTSVGNHYEAVRIWQLIGDRASLETSTFRERYGLNPSTYGNRLAELLELSGNMLRAELVRDMLRKIDKPEGRHL